MERLPEMPVRVEPTVTPAKTPVVLAIDDDPNVIYLLQENLMEAGYQVIGAMHGPEGLQKARQLKPFVIILDILMPHKDGWQVLHELKADATTRDIPVVLLSIVDQKDLGYPWAPLITCSSRLTVRPFWPLCGVSHQRITASSSSMMTHRWWSSCTSSSTTSRMRSRLLVTDRRPWKPWPGASLM